MHMLFADRPRTLPFDVPMAGSSVWEAIRSDDIPVDLPFDLPLGCSVVRRLPVCATDLPFGLRFDLPLVHFTCDVAATAR